MIPTREQELAVLRSVIYASLFDYPLTLAQLESSLIGVRADAATIECVVARERSAAGDDRASRRLYFPAGRSDLVRTRSRREALSRELLDRDRRILSLRRGHAVRAHGGAIGQPRAPQRRRLRRSRSVRDHRAEPRVERDCRDAGGVEAAWLAQAALHELRGVGAGDGDRAGRICFRRIRSFTCGRSLGTRCSSDSSSPIGFVREFYPNFELTQSQALQPFGATARQLLSAAKDCCRSASRSWPSAWRAALYGWHLRRRSATLAIERSGEARTGMLEAAYQQPSGVDACEVRRRDG